MWITDFVKCLEESTLAHPRINEALAIKQQHLPKRIYKYRRDCANSRHNLKTDTVWLSSPESYNDPYDCWLTMSDDLLATLIDKRLVDVFANTYKLPNIVGAERIGSTRIKGLANEVVATVQGWRGMTKLCSFSAVNDSMLMWSHYSDNHRGFCLEYDLETLSADHLFRKNLYPVVYSNDLFDLAPYAEKLLDPDRQKFNDLYLLLALIHKFDGWKYEEEWRVLAVKDTVLADRNLPAPTPSRIFLGSRLDASTSTELLGICEERNIPVYRMRLADNKFALLPEPFIG
jgi:hypothetical protein